METKHTKGPWQVKHSQSNPAFNVVGTHVGCRYKIARCPYNASPIRDDEVLERERKEAEANAKLIAAAPELLEALINLNHEIDKISNGDKSEKAVLRVEDAQRKSWDIIKKATE